MNIDWTLFARWLAPIAAVFVGAGLNRYLERRPKLFTYLAHSSAVTVKPSDAAPIIVHSHSIVVRNAGSKPAMNVRLGHNHLPDFSVYPSVPFEQEALPGGGSELRFPVLVGGEQITVTYLYFPPRLWSEIHSYAKSDEGFARVLRVLPTPQPARWVRIIFWTLVAIGSATLLAAIYQLVILAWIRVLG